MHAITIAEFGAPEVMRLSERPDLTPAPGQIVVAMKAAGVNPVDTYIRAGIYGPKPFPYTPGTDGAGVVERVGDGISRFSPGDRVYLSGTLSGSYASHALCLEKHLHPLPDRLSFEEGAAIGIPYGTAFRALFHRAKTASHDTVLVHGASGAVGIAALQLCNERRIAAFATAGTPEGRELCIKQGARKVLDHRDPNHFNELMALTDHRGADVILEMLANVNLAKDLTVCARFGRIVVIGSRGTIEINPRDAMSRDASILGMALFNAGDEDLSSIYSSLDESFSAGRLMPVIGKRLPLNEAARAHHEIIESTAYGKNVLMP